MTSGATGDSYFSPWDMGYFWISCSGNSRFSKELRSRWPPNKLKAAPIIRLSSFFKTFRFSDPFFLRIQMAGSPFLRAHKQVWKAQKVKRQAEHAKRRVDKRRLDKINAALEAAARQKDFRKV